LRYITEIGKVTKNVAERDMIEAEIAENEFIK
jgi:hypothetical protein